MNRTTRRLLSLLLLLAAVGCHRCGDRPRLFSRLRDRNPDDDGERRGVDRFRDSERDGCDDPLPAPRPKGTENSFGQPVSKGGGRFVSPLSGIPYSDPLPVGGFPPGTSFPYGNPVIVNPPARRDDELPSPGYTIPPTVVPATPRSTDGGKLFPPLGGGIVTGDPKK
jgi:hypothetical protein